MTSKLEQLRAMPAQDMTTVPKVYAWEQQDSMVVSAVCRAVGVVPSTPVYDKAEAFKKKHGTLEGWSPVQATNVGVLIKKAVTAAMKEAGVEPHKLPQRVVEIIYRDSLDRIEQGTRPSVSQQINAHSTAMPRSMQWTSAIRGRKTDSRNKAALSKLEAHPVMQTITRAGTDVAGIHNGTMSHSIKKIGEAFTLAQRVSAKVATWFADITAVLSVAKVVGADVMVDAALAPNKTMAALGIDLHVREKLTASAQAGVPVMAAGRGLMILKTAKIDALSLDLGDVELAAAMALFQYFPDSIEGATMQSAELRFGSIVLRTDADGVVAYREAVQSNASGLLPHTALIAADGKALAALQAKVDTRLAGLDYAFTSSADNGGMTIEERRLRDFGKSAVTTY